MGIILNDNLEIKAGKPADGKYLKKGVKYTSVSDVNTTIPIQYRYIGLTVNVNNVEYWYKYGLDDVDLIEKKYDTLIPSGDFITGATNIGYFSGHTGIQVLPMNHLSDNTYDGNYYSLYNNYYRGVDGVIHVGVPSDGIAKRGYVKTSGLVKSWVWNEYTGGGDLLGWVLIDGDISNMVGTFQYSGQQYYGISVPYTLTSFVSGNYYSNGSELSIDVITGSLNTGNTMTVGGRTYAFAEHNNLHFRTVLSKTPNIISVTDDETFVYLSGVTSQASGVNIGSGAGSIYAGLSGGTTFMFRNIVGSGGTVVNNVGNNVVVYSSGSSNASNGLTRIGGSIVLGGTLTGNTIIGGNSKKLTIGCSSSSLDEFNVYGNNLTISSCNTNYVDFGTNPKGITYNNCYHNSYVNRSLVDKEYVDNRVTSYTGGTVFNSNIVVSIANGKTFGRYVNGDIIPAMGKTANEVLLLATAEPITPLINLGSLSTNVSFGLNIKNVSLSFSYVILSLNGSVSSVLLEWRRNNSGSWSGLTTNVNSTAYSHNINDSTNRFNSDVINYRYIVIDTLGASGSTTFNVTLEQYLAPTITPTYVGTVGSYETQQLREMGNVNTTVGGGIISNRNLVNINAYRIQRSVNGGSFNTIASETSLSTLNKTITSYLDSGSAANASNVMYRIQVDDEYTTTTGVIYGIDFRYASYYGYSNSSILNSSGIVLLGNQALLTSKTRTMSVTAHSGEYTYVTYPSSFGDISNIIMDGSAPVLGAFSKLSNVVVTNAYGQSVTNIVYKTNATQAFTNNTIAVS